MLWTQWGQSGKLLRDESIWLCHQCNDCSIRCPRNARPGDVLAALRSLSIRHYSVPAFMARIVQDPKWLPAALLIPVAFVLAMLAVDGHLATLLAPPRAQVHFAEHFLSHLVLNTMFSAAFFFFLILGFAGVARFWREMEKETPIPADKDPGMVKGMLSALTELLAHRKFRLCTATENRYWGHFSTLYGFAVLFVVTGIVVILILIAPESYPIMSLSNPLKLAGNLGAILLIAGSLIAIGSRLSEPATAGSSTYFDWFFLTVIASVGITGVLTEAARFMEGASWAYWMYFFHLVLVFALLCYLPYSKFGHLLFRYFAIVHAKRRTGNQSAVV
jgi:quinone-modifying oxidoreductase subunit QmoC